MNSKGSSKKVQFHASCPTDNVLELLELTLSFDVTSKQILVDVFSKPTNSFTYVMPSTCFPRRNIEKVPNSVTLKLRRICDTDSKFKIRNNEYQQYLLARGYKPHKVSKQFFDVARISRETAWQPRVKMDFKVTSILTEFNPLSPVNKLLYGDPKMEISFPEKSIKAIYKRGKNLKETLSPSSFSSTKNLIVGSVRNCNERCDICSNLMIFHNTFKCTATSKYYKVKGTLSYNSVNLIYLITCQCCKLQYVGSAITLHKIDINTGKKSCGAAKHFLECCTIEGKFDNLKIQLIVSVNVPNGLLEQKL